MKPAAYYFREAARTAYEEGDSAKLFEISEQLVRELETLKTQVRELGQIPARCHDVANLHFGFYESDPHDEERQVLLAFSDPVDAGSGRP